jgi:cell division transport system permease protein
VNIFYFIKEALRGFYEAKLMTFVSIVTIGLTLFFLGAVSIAYLNIRLWIKNASNRVEAVVFVDDATAKDSVSLAELVSRVRAFGQVASATVIDKQEAWSRFKDLYGGRMLEAVDDNPFPVSLDLSLSEKSQTVAAAESLKQALAVLPGVEDIQLSQQWVMLIQRFRNYFLIATVCVGCVLFLALHFMISNTIKLTIYARKELVRNMQFVGATNAFIKAPFILEGMLQGIIGGVFGVLALCIVKMSLSHVPLFWGPWYLFLVIFPIGALFGCIGSMSAVRKFLVW